MNSSTGPVKAVIKSIYYAVTETASWTALPQAFYIALSVIVSLAVVPKCTFRFRRPLIAVALAFLLFASQLTPSVFAMSHIGYERQIDIYYYSYYLLIFFSAFYVTGWFYRQVGSEDGGIAEKSGLGRIAAAAERHAFSIALIMALLTAAGSFSAALPKPTSLVTTSFILDGSVRQYDIEYKEILAKLTSGEKNVKIKELQTVPPFFTVLTISEDENFWVNQCMADYFDLESLKLDSSR